MMFNPYLAQQLREERVKDALREVEQVRLIRAAKGAEVDDQAVVHGLLVKIRDMGLPTPVTWLLCRVGVQTGQ